MSTPSLPASRRDAVTPPPAGSVADMTGARTKRRDVPSIAFRGAVVLVIGSVLAGPGGLPDVLAAVPLGHVHDPGAELHRWHMIDIGAYLSLLTVGTLVVAAWRPRRSTALVQTVLLSLVGFALLALTMPSPDEVLVPVAMVAALLIGAFPRRRDLLRVPHLAVRSRLALAAAALPTPFLVLNLWHNLDRQVGGTDPHALLGHWAGAAALAFALLLTVWVAATRVPAARGLAVVVAGTLLYLGVSALVHGSHDGAWPRWGGVLAVVGGALFLVSARRTSAPSTRPLRRGPAAREVAG